MKRKKQRIAIAAAGIFLVAAAAFLILKPPADPLAAVPSELAEQVTLTPTENLPGHVVLEAYYTPPCRGGRRRLFIPGLPSHANQSGTVSSLLL